MSLKKFDLLSRIFFYHERTIPLSYENYTIDDIIMFRREYPTDKAEHSISCTLAILGSPTTCCAPSVNVENVSVTAIIIIIIWEKT